MEVLKVGVRVATGGGALRRRSPSGSRGEIVHLISMSIMDQAGMMHYLRIFALCDLELIGQVLSQAQYVLY